MKYKCKTDNLKYFVKGEIYDLIAAGKKTGKYIKAYCAVIPIEKKLVI